MEPFRVPVQFPDRDGQPVETRSRSSGNARWDQRALARRPGRAVRAPTVTRRDPWQGPIRPSASRSQLMRLLALFMLLTVLAPRANADVPALPANLPSVHAVRTDRPIV